MPRSGSVLPENFVHFRRCLRSLFLKVSQLGKHVINHTAAFVPAMLQVQTWTQIACVRSDFVYRNCLDLIRGSMEVKDSVCYPVNARILTTLLCRHRFNHQNLATAFFILHLVRNKNNCIDALIPEHFTWN